MEKKQPETIYEDTNVLVVHKPAGLLVHGDGKANIRTLADWVLENYQDMDGVGESAVYEGVEIARPGIVHRLDKDTSGVMVLAKHQKSFIFLKEQFQKRTVEKTYKAFVYGVLKEKEGIIDRPLGRSTRDIRRWSAYDSARGALREAQTAYVVEKEGAEASYLSLTPHTGRTHQLRVHLQYIGHPIVCDPLYAPKRDCILGFSRLALHAHKLSVALPSGERVLFEAPLPADFVQALEELGRV